MSPPAAIDVKACRAQFPAFERLVEGRTAVFFDGPAGSQVPLRVADAVRHCLLHTNANSGGAFATSIESAALFEAAQAAVADFLGSADGELAAFGPNMTTLTFALSRALSRTWAKGDEILVTESEHDANFTPWVLAAADAGATVRSVRIRPEDSTINLDDLKSKLGPKTRFLALGCASNATGTSHPIGEIIELVHEVGGLVFLDAVHYAPHRRLQVDKWNADFLACSAYKFFGPHIGILWGRRSLLEKLPTYKVRTSPEKLPWRWMTGTESFEGLAGTEAAIEYLADIGRAAGSTGDRREALDTAYEAISAHETALTRRLLDGFDDVDGLRVWGITDSKRLSERVATISFTMRNLDPKRIATKLARRGIFVWSGNFYALPQTEALGLEPTGLVRVGLLHYNTEEEVDRLIAATKELSRL